METILKVTQESTQRTVFFQNFESFFVKFFKVFYPKVDTNKTPLIHFDIELSSNSFNFTVENDNYIISTQTVL